MLMMNKPAQSELPKRLIWNHQDEKENKDISAQINSFLEKGFTLTEIDKGEVILNPPNKPDSMCVVRVLDETGDSRLVWDRNSLEEVKEAKKKFEELVAKGYKGYVVRRDGSKGSRVESFDSLVEELLMVKNTGQGGGEGIMVPPTSPG